MSRTVKYEKPKDSWTMHCREQIRKDRKKTNANLKDQLKRKDYDR